MKKSSRQMYRYTGRIKYSKKIPYYFKANDPAISKCLMGKWQRILDLLD